MHTALRLGVALAARVRIVNPTCHIAFYGLYAALNAEYLLKHAADSVMSGEIEDALVELVQQLERSVVVPKPRAPSRPHPILEKLAFPLPSRSQLPALKRYAHVEKNGALELAGYVEASRGCKHLCRHCPIPPVYGGRFFVVPREVVLANLAKGHSRADVFAALHAVRAAGIALRPTWVPFTPWTTLDDYRKLLDVVEAHALIDAIDSVQYSIRLLVPPGSLLLETDAMRPFLGPLVEGAFYYRWTHPDARMERLHAGVSALVAGAADAREDATATFNRIRQLADETAGAPPRPDAAQPPERTRPPRLTEPWFC